MSLGENFDLASLFTDPNEKLLRDKDFYRSQYKDEYSAQEISEGLDKGYEMTTTSGIIPAWDNSDHLDFACRKCFYSVKIVSVHASITSGKPTINFTGFCENCGNSGNRKIYIGESEPARTKKTAFPLRKQDLKIRTSSRDGEKYEVKE